jgi:hypothetical protein
MTKKTPTTTKTAKPTTAPGIDRDVKLEDLKSGDRVEVTILLTADEDQDDGMFRFEDCDGDSLYVTKRDIIRVRPAPPDVVQVTGSGSERATRILRDAGFTVG